MTLKHTHEDVNTQFTTAAVDMLSEVCVPVGMCPAVHESRSLHGQRDVLQSEAVGVGEGDGHEHLMLHTRNTAHLQSEKKKNNMSPQRLLFITEYKNK